MARPSYTSSPSLEVYWAEIRDIPPLPREEEQRLARLIQAGDLAARDTLVRANLRFALSVAVQYEGKGMSLPDLVSEANDGLIEAAERFDPSRGFKFITYAVWWLRQRLCKAVVQANRALRQPQSRIATRERLRRAAEELAQVEGAWPTAETVRRAVGVSEGRHLTAEMVSGPDMSLDEPVYADSTETALDCLVDGAEGAAALLEGSEWAGCVQRVLGRLDRREAIVLRAWFCFDGEPPRTLEEIGRTLGVTRERVRQIRNHALEKLRHYVEEEGVHYEDVVA